MNRLFGAVFASLLIMGMSSGLVTAAATDKQQVVYHVNYYGPKAHVGALRNIQNHINAVGAANLDLKVVLHGNGVAMLMYPDAVGKNENKMKEGNATEEMQATIAGLKDQGIQFQICANTLKGRNISTDDLYDFAESDVVPSGVAQLAILQGQGYAYVKP
jgi:intracellular sulfur oxidation DsrE/DsrF family protein